MARPGKIEPFRHSQAIHDGTPHQPGALDSRELELLFADFNHRMRNLLAVVQLLVGQTRSATVDEYRAVLSARLSGFQLFYELADLSGSRRLSLADLIKHTLRPYDADGGRILAAGPDLDLPPKLALVLHIVFNELATNANKYGSLSGSNGYVSIKWKIRRNACAGVRLAILWTEHGGPEVKPPLRQGLGSRLIRWALEEYGLARFDFRPAGLACFMLLALDRPGRTPAPS